MLVVGSGEGAVASDGQALDTSSNATVYSARWSARESGFSVHVEYGNGSSLTSVATLWVSNKPNPDESDDSDWVQNSDITFTNITTGTSAKEAHTAGNAAFRWYRLKIATSNGTGNAQAWVFHSRANAR